MLFPVACGPTNTVRSPKLMSASLTGPIFLARIRFIMRLTPRPNSTQFTTVMGFKPACSVFHNSANRNKQA